VAGADRVRQKLTAILGGCGLAGTLTFATFQSTEVSPLNLTGAIALGTFAGDLFVTVGAVAVVRPRPALDVKDFAFTAFTFQPGHASSSLDRVNAAGEGGRGEREFGIDIRLCPNILGLSWRENGLVKSAFS
jgi:hypothetical protein